ncbi:MAG: ribosome-binding factor A, partial [Bacteroidales bacterium]|nr:ribosome-binding factor A [Bacteroidales bacterium]
GKEAVLKAIKGHAAEIRYLLGRQVHDQLRILPQLQFFIDDTLDRVARIDELLAQ